MIPLLSFAFLGLAGLTQAHIAAWHKGMYCLNGTVPGFDNQNNNDAVNPVFKMPKSEWWMHHNNKCDEFPPAPGDFLELPAGGTFTVEFAGNRGQTTLSFGGKFTSEWPDGQQHPEDFSMPNNGCITSPNLHTTNQSDAAGTVFAISAISAAVTAENLAVFTALYHTPWKRIGTFQVPADLPPCPPGGCIAVFGWVPNGCGIPNMYMHPYRAKVTNSKSTKVVAPAKPPVWCEGTPSTCTKGAKQMVFWNQADGNNIVTTGYQADGSPKSPGYNMKLGFQNGAQNDIFL
ncbi:hypothetical protein BS47DRAFT_1336747 [Hydnum rufescens UP504]|uniref:Uncharacterized protein n=1 Tax=Hydnum rufescens UP504 TaxID=1448309 RepID=A0A9P6E249_9AGAM|nr:hypothetical protein BS47DRAFT_1336747 [Hydnum rufescens UP504]